MGPQDVTTGEALDRMTQYVCRLSGLYRWTEGIQIIIVATMGQYIFSGGSQRLSGKHWVPLRDALGGYQTVGLILWGISILGLLSLISLAFADRGAFYQFFGWSFSLLAGGFLIAIGVAHGLASLSIPGAGSTGLWSFGLAGLFFITTRVGMSLTSRILSVLDAIPSYYALTDKGEESCA